MKGAKTLLATAVLAMCVGVSSTEQAFWGLKWAVVQGVAAQTDSLWKGAISAGAAVFLLGLVALMYLWRRIAGPMRARDRALARLETAVRVATSPEPLPPDVLALNPQGLTGLDEQRVLMWLAAGEIGMAHNLGLITDAERDAYLHRLPAVPLA